MGSEDRSFKERLRGLQTTIDAWLKKSPSANVAVTAATAFAVGELVAAPLRVILAIAAIAGAIVFVFLYLEKSPRGGDAWLPKLREVFKKTVARLTQGAVIALVVAGTYALAAALLAGEPPPPPDSTPTPPPPSTAPPTSEPPTEETDEPVPSPTTQRAAPTSRDLEEVEIRKPELRGVIEEPYVVTGLDHEIAEPWDFEQMRICASARIGAPATPAWRDSLMFDADYDESASSAAATFYTAEDATAWIGAVVENVDRCRIEVGPTHPRIAGEDEVWRFRTHINDYGRLNVDRIIARVDNVVLQVVVARYEGNNQTVVEDVAAKCIQRLVSLIQERDS